MAFYVKAGWDEKKCPKKYDGVELKFGENAFASVEEALKALEAENQKIKKANDAADAANKPEDIKDYLYEIVLVDSKTEWAKEIVVDVTGDSVATEYVNFTGKGSLNLSKGDYSKVTFKLTPAAADSGTTEPGGSDDTGSDDPTGQSLEEDEPTTVTASVQFNGFSKVTVGADAQANSLYAYKDKDTFYNKGKENESLKSDGYDVSGKIDIFAEPVVTGSGDAAVTETGVYSVNGYKTVTVKEGAYVGYIDGGKWSTKYAKLAEEPKYIYGNVYEGVKPVAMINGLETESSSAASGSVVVEKAAQVDDIDGYAKVALKEGSTVGSIDAETDKYDAKKITFAKFETNADGTVKADTIEELTWSGDYSVQFDDGEGYSSVKVANSAVFEDKNVKGSIAITKADTVVGSLQAEKATVTEDINGFSAVKLTDSVVENVRVEAKDSSTEKWTFKTDKKAGVYTGVYTDNDKSVAVGSFTAVNSFVGKVNAETPALTTRGSINGYKTVKLTNTSVNGGIAGNLDTVSSAKYESEKCTSIEFVAGGEPIYEYELKTADLKKINKEVDEDAAVADADKAAAKLEKVIALLNAEAQKLFVRDDAKKLTEVGAKQLTAIDWAKLDEVTAETVAVKIQKVEEGNLVVDEDENPVYYQALDKDGEPVVTEDQKGILSFADAPVRYGRKLSSSSQTAATGSVTVSLDKKAPKEVAINGSITDYSKVTLNGVVDKEGNATLVKVDGWVSGYTTEKDTYKDGTKVDAEKQTIKGTISTTDKDTAAGSLKATAAVINGGYYHAISDFKSVTLKNSVVERDVYADYNYSNNNSEAWKITKDGGTVTIKDVTTNTGVASFTASDSTIGVFAKNAVGNVGEPGYVPAVERVDADIDGFKTVKLTNTSVTGGISTYRNYKDTTKTVYTYDKFDAANDDYGVRFDGESDNDFAKVATKEFDYTGINKVQGVLSVKVDKKAAADAYEIGAVYGFKSVDIAGLEIKADDVVTYKMITVAGLTASQDLEEKEKWTRTYKYDADGNVDAANSKYETVEYYDKYTAVATAKVTNAVVTDDIADFAKVTLNNVTVDGGIYTGNSITTYEWKEQKGENNIVYDWSSKRVSSYGSAVGSLTMDDAKVSMEKSVSGFKTVDIKDGLNSFGWYNGLDVAENAEASLEGYLAETEKDAAESIKIAKKATLVTNYLDLGKEDKLTVDGNLVLWGRAEDDSTTEVEKGKVVGDLTSIAGKGTIYVDKAAKAEIKGFNGKVVDLGDTAKNFWGVEAELADNECKKETAIVLKDGESGWLGLYEKDSDTAKAFGELLGDAIDYVKVELAQGEKVIITSDAWDAESKDLVAGAALMQLEDGSYGYVFTATASAEDKYIKIERKDAGSMNYDITIA